MHAFHWRYRHSRSTSADVMQVGRSEFQEDSFFRHVFSLNGGIETAKDGEEHCECIEASVVGVVF